MSISNSACYVNPSGNNFPKDKSIATPRRRAPKRGTRRNRGIFASIARIESVREWVKLAKERVDGAKSLLLVASLAINVPALAAETYEMVHKYVHFILAFVGLPN